MYLKHLIEFPTQKARELEANLGNNDVQSINKYDELLVIISCHRLEGYILTSDYEKISKVAIANERDKELRMLRNQQNKQKFYYSFCKRD